MALNVMMMGGRRCGKTSALASTFDQTTNGPVKDVFTVCDSTNYVTKMNIDGVLERQETLIGKRAELEFYLENEPTGVFLVDSGPTRCDWTYSLGLQIPGTGKKMNIDFLDCPGEFFEQGLHDETTNNFVEGSDVYIIMVDTPYIMECRDSIAKGVNCIDDIHNFMTNIKCDTNNKETSKMVLFVPIKCEKWAKENRLGEVADKIKSLYDTTIKALCAFNYMTIAIIPIQTAGNIEYMEMKDAYILNGTDGKCCKTSEQWLRMKDGTTYKLKQTDKLNPDMESVIVGNVRKPSAWYRISRNQSRGRDNSLYNPYNCEQIPLHILNFWFEKGQECKPGGFIGWLKGIFGGITKNDMQNCLAQLNRLGLIKNGVDGIEYIKKAVY